MQKAEKYREYAADCRRLAERATRRDRDVLLKIAEAWDELARFAEVAGKKRSPP
jgi:hypothetical protein